MQILHKDNKVSGIFYVEENDEVLAEMTYKWTGEQTFTIEHTEVNEKLEGKGIGRQLVNAAVEFARTNHYKIIPVCSYARRVFERTKEYEDVWERE